jgi:UrcA family protein
MKVRSTLLALAAVAAATLMTGIAASPAMAGEAPMAGEAAVTVPYADLNLASPGARELLGHRVFQAATMVCGRYDPRDLRLSALSQACRNQAIARARPQLDATFGGGGARYASRSVSQAAF